MFLFLLVSSMQIKAQTAWLERETEEWSGRGYRA